MGILSKLKITAPKKPRVLKSNTDDHSSQSTYETVIDGSQSIYETVEGSHEYKIKGYSLAKGMGVGEFMTSGQFTVGGYDWVVKFYPDGYEEASEEYVAVFLKLANPGEVRASFQFKLMDQSGKGIHRLRNNSTPEMFKQGKVSAYQCWGFVDVLKRSELETLGYLKNDCLRIHCTVRVIQTRVEEEKHYAMHVPPSDMIQNLKGMLESEMGYDITFQVGNECFRAHKLILAARSPVFRAMFFGSVGNPNMETEVIKEFDPFTFKAMLLFLYSDELPEAHELSDSHSFCTSTTLMQHLLAAADRFCLARLKLMCEAKLCEEITADTVAETLALAELYQFMQLKTICLNFAAKPENLEEVMKSDGYAYLETICPSLLADLLKTCAVINKK